MGKPETIFLGLGWQASGEARSSETYSETNRRADMSKDQDRSVFRGGDGEWKNKRHDASKASSSHDTQQEALQAAKRMLGNQGGGELTTMGRDGVIRSKDTIAPGRDPHPPKDREH